jgi:hypothetical protein
MVATSPARPATGYPALHRLSDRDNFTLIMISSPILESPLFADLPAFKIQDNSYYHELKNQSDNPKKSIGVSRDTVSKPFALVISLDAPLV